MNDNKPQMVPGFNHNVKHLGKVYHVQTEDSGVANPHIITHLFVGGNILATKKTSYADIVQANNLHDVVKELMQEQHKAMLRNLINGVYDEVLEGGTSGATLPGGSELPPMSPGVSSPPQEAHQESPQGQEQPQEPTTKPRDFSRARTEPSMPAVAPQKFPAATETPPSAAMGVTPKPMAKEVPKVEPPVPRPPPAPAPRKPVSTGEFTEGRRPVTKTRIHVPEEPQVETVPLMQRATARVTVRPKAGGPPVVMPPEVLAAQKLSNKPKPKDTSGPTIFGEDLITEKSLDEVIIGYLSGDGEDGG